MKPFKINRNSWHYKMINNTIINDSEGIEGTENRNNYDIEDREDRMDEDVLVDICCR